MPPVRLDEDYALACKKALTAILAAGGVRADVVEYEIGDRRLRAEGKAEIAKAIKWLREEIDYANVGIIRRENGRVYNRAYLNPHNR